MQTLLKLLGRKIKMVIIIIVEARPKGTLVFLGKEKSYEKNRKFHAGMDIYRPLGKQAGA